MRKYIYLLVIFAIPSVSWAQTWNGEFVNVCPDMEYTYSFNPPSITGESCVVSSLTCQGCYDAVKTGNEIKLKWGFGTTNTLNAVVSCYANSSEHDIPYSQGVTQANSRTPLFVCAGQTSSFYTAFDNPIPASDSRCSDTNIKVTLTRDGDYGTGFANKGYPFDRSKTTDNTGIKVEKISTANGVRPSLTMYWLSGWTGSIVVSIEYEKRKWDITDVFGKCETDPWKELASFTFVRGGNPLGSLAGPDEVILENPTATINLAYQKQAGYTGNVLGVRYFLNGTKVAEKLSCLGDISGYTYSHTAAAKGSLAFSTQVKDECGSWWTGPSKTVNVKQNCAIQSPSDATLSVQGVELKDGSFTLESNQNYNLVTSGITNFSNHYDWSVVDGGQDITLNGNTFSISKKFGSYRIGVVPKPGQETCPVPTPITLTLGGHDMVLRKANGCDIVLPDDLDKLVPPDMAKLGFNSDLAVLAHFRATVKSERSITVKPGITLDLGAELVLEFPAPTPVPEDPDKQINFMEALTRDDYGRVLTNTKSYYDNAGKLLQTQFKDLTKQVVLGNAIIFDSYGRPVVTTLPAPIRASTIETQLDKCGVSIKPENTIDFKYKLGFVQASQGNEYDYADFDRYMNGATVVNKENDPAPVYASEEGTLGWYYSSRNGESTNPKMNEEFTATTQFPYSRTIFHRDGSASIKGTTKPGDTFRAGAHVATSVNEQVSESDIYLLKYLAMRSSAGNGLALTSPASANEFFKVKSTDENGKVSVTYTDKSGHAIISLYFGSLTSPITKSYQFYDLAGRLIASVSPNGVEQYEKTTNPVSFAAIDKTIYHYNAKGLLSAMEETDAGRTEYVYRRDGKIRFSQNAKQRNANTYSYTHYDRSGRPIESGEYIAGNDGVAFKSAGMTAILENTNITGGLPGGASNKRDIIQTYYDEPAEQTAGRIQRFILGAVSYTKKFETSDPSSLTVTTAYSYDEQGRVEWIVQNIAGLGVKTIDYRYGPTGQVQEVLYQKANDTERFSHYYRYDADGRLYQVFTSRAALQYDKKGDLLNEGELKLQATYYYYLHGPLKRVALGADYVQGIDYTYTADGSLKAINNADPDNDATRATAKDPGKDGFGNGFRKDVFGMSLEYYTNDYKGANDVTDNATISSETAPQQYGGHIRAARWHSPVEPDKQFSYAYHYDERYQLSQADWGTINAGVFVPNPISYKEGISEYDNNGNIRQLNRTSSLGNNIANFQYQYIDNTNKLNQILNQDDQNDILRAYEYNEIGELKNETGAGTTEKHIEYDVTGKVKKIYRDATKIKLAVSFTYDDRGFRLSKTSYDDQGNAKFKNWYVRDASGNVMGTYEQDLANSKPLTLAELPIYGKSRIGLHDAKHHFNMYEINDHLGNVRAVIGEPVTFEYLATMESERFAKEHDYGFINMSNDVTATDYNHTPATVQVEGEQPETIESPNEVDRMNNMPIAGDPTDPIGTGIKIWIHPGDVINAEVFVKYTDFNEDNPSPINLAATLLTTAFGPSPIAIDGTPIFNAVDQPGFLSSQAFTKITDEQPRAFLNCLLFDNDGKLQLYDIDQVSSDAKITGAMPHERLTLRVTAQKEGYAYIYVSNQTNQNTEVYFDDLRVTHTLSDIVAGGDYYPFGLAIKDRQIERDFYRHGYQGQFAEKDEESGWNHFELREYDPVIGRWLQKDPFSQHYSPYAAMDNNPINKTDHNGGLDEFNVLNGKYTKIGDKGGSQTNYYHYLDGDLKGQTLIRSKTTGGSWSSLWVDTNFLTSMEYQIPQVNDATAYVLKNAIGLKLIKEYSKNLIIYADEDGGGPGINKRDPNQDPAAEPLELTEWLEYFEGRTPSEHGIIENQSEGNASVHGKPDSILIIHNSNRYQNITGGKLGKPFYENYRYKIDRNTGKIIDGDTSRTYTGN